MVERGGVVKGNFAGKGIYFFEGYYFGEREVYKGGFLAM